MSAGSSRVVRRIEAALVMLLFACVRGGVEKQVPRKEIFDADPPGIVLLEAKSSARSGNRHELARFLRLLVSAQRDDESKAEFGNQDWAALNEEAERLLDEWIASGEENAETDGTWHKAELLMVTGRENQAVAVFEALYERAPSFDSAYGLLWFHMLAQVPMVDAASICAAHGNLVEGEEKVVLFLLACVTLTPGDSLETRLPWASAADIELFERAWADFPAWADRMNDLQYVSTED